MQVRRTNHTDVCVEMFMPLPMCPIGESFRRALEMNREDVATDAGIERLVAKVQLESKPFSVIRNRRIEVVHQELRRDSGELCGTRYGLSHHSLRPPFALTLLGTRQPLARRPTTYYASLFASA